MCSHHTVTRQILASLRVRAASRATSSTNTGFFQGSTGFRIEWLWSTICQTFHFQRLLGHQQVTDAYLLAIAATHDAILLTLDRRLVPPDTARQHIEVIAP